LERHTWSWQLEERAAATSLGKRRRDAPFVVALAATVLAVSCHPLLPVPSLPVHGSIAEGDLTLGRPRPPGGTLIVGAVRLRAIQFQGSPRVIAEGRLVDGGDCVGGLDYRGAIVLCRRGDDRFADKVNSVRKGGGVGVVIHNDTGSKLRMVLGEGKGATIPVVGLRRDDGRIALGKVGEHASLVVEGAVETDIPTCVDPMPGVPNTGRCPKGRVCRGTTCIRPETLEP